MKTQYGITEISISDTSCTPTVQKCTFTDGPLLSNEI